MRPRRVRPGRGPARFLELAPDDPDAEQVKTLVYELEFKAERAARGEDKLKALLGTWDRYDADTGEQYNAYEFRARGTEVEVRLRDAVGEIVVPVEFDGTNVRFKCLFKMRAAQVQYEIRATLDPSGIMKGTMANVVVSAEPGFPTRPGHKGSVATVLRKR